jgi:hypothetical protein
MQPLRPRRRLLDWLGKLRRDEAQKGRGASAFAAIDPERGARLSATELRQTAFYTIQRSPFRHALGIQVHVIPALAREEILPDLPHRPRWIVRPTDARVFVVAHDSLLYDHKTGRAWPKPEKRATPYVDKPLGSGAGDKLGARIPSQLGNRSVMPEAYRRRESNWRSRPVRPQN